MDRLLERSLSFHFRSAGTLLEETEVEEVPVPSQTVEEKPLELKASPIVEKEVLHNEDSTESMFAGGLRTDIVPEPESLSAPENDASPPIVVPQTFDVIQMVDNQTYHFELIDAKSHKFWEIILNGTEFTTRYGRVGSSGQSQTKTWANDALCKREALKLIREKLRKGYQSNGAA